MADQIKYKKSCLGDRKIYLSLHRKSRYPLRHVISGGHGGASRPPMSGKYYANWKSLTSLGIG